ncbi:hypothetical protein D9758_005844 [Tetrapyrgos nigripes]|uniref:Uncharacterized protein n=1 Tax=Tetrapyrgos nigripes TaxID=182062 RepID=A0A8H5LHG8_9AGAR|nr:hypothetical protein D9758_005844 [Tetrapyrgos nigripes]
MASSLSSSFTSSSTTSSTSSSTTSSTSSSTTSSTSPITATLTIVGSSPNDQSTVTITSTPTLAAERVSSGPNVGAIVGGIIGGMVLAALITAAFFIWLARRYNKPVVRSVPGDRLRDLEAIQGRPAPPRNPMRVIVDTITPDPSKRSRIMNWITGVRPYSDDGHGSAVEMTGGQAHVSTSTPSNPEPSNASNRSQSLYSQPSYRDSTMLEGRPVQQEVRLSLVPEEEVGKGSSPVKSHTHLPLLPPES